MSDWVKIDRRMLSKQWFSDGKTVQVYLYLLLSATAEDVRRGSVTLRRGQAMITLRDMAEKLELSVHALRLRLEKLVESRDVARKTAHNAAHGSTIITICDYDSYVCEMGENGTLAAQETAQETAHEKRNRKEEKPLSLPLSPHTPLSLSLSSKEVKDKENIYIPPPPPNFKIISLASSLSAAELAAEKQSWYDLFFWANCPCCSAQVTRFFRHNEKFGWKAKASDYVYDTKEARYALAQTWTQNEKFPRNRWKDSFLAVWRTLSIEATNSSPETLKWLKSPKIALSLEGAYSDKSWTLRVPSQVARYIAGNERASLLLRDYFLAQSETQKYRIVSV